MSDEKEKTQSNELNIDKVVEFINTIDKLYYEKPAGYLAYLHTCQSATSLTSFSDKSQEKK